MAISSNKLGWSRSGQKINILVHAECSTIDSEGAGFLETDGTTANDLRRFSPFWSSHIFKVRLLKCVLYSVVESPLNETLIQFILQ